MPTFRGFILGLRREQVRTVLEAAAIPAQVQGLPPPLSLVLGLSRGRVLGRKTAPSLRRMLWRLMLFGFWSVVTVVFLGTIASFLVPVSTEVRVILTLTGVVLGLATLMATGWYWTRVVDGDKDLADLGAAADVPWDVLIMAPEAGLVALGVTLVVVFVSFILFAVWIPLLFVALNLLTMGELWRRYRLVFVEMPVDRPERIGWTGRELLRRGGVLSRSWDAHLDLTDVGRAQRTRDAHGRIERRLILVGMASLFLAGLLLTRRYFPPDAWDLVIYGDAALTGLALVILLASLLRARTARIRAA